VRGTEIVDAVVGVIQMPTLATSYGPTAPRACDLAEFDSTPPEFARYPVFGAVFALTHSRFPLRGEESKMVAPSRAFVSEKSVRSAWSSHALRPAALGRYVLRGGVLARDGSDAAARTLSA
jgi:hypothetical protein